MTLTSQNSTGLEIDGDFNRSIGEDVIKVRLKDEAVIKYLSEGIYTSWKSAVRELFANELTAALTAREMGANPTIEITLDPEKRELTIQGIDSLGITQEVFADKLIYYGRSGNTSSKRPGMFGFGLKCVSADTECLTEDGWKRYADLHVGELIATYDIEKKLVEYKPLGAIHTYEFRGQLFKLAWRHGPLVTVNHRNVASRLHRTRQGGIGKRGYFGKHDSLTRKRSTPSNFFPRKKVRIEEIVETVHLSNTDKILLSAPHSYVPNAGVGSEDLATLIGWVITEGHYLKTNGKGKQDWRPVTTIKISQNEGNYAEEIRGLLRRLGMTWREEARKSESGNTNILFAIHGLLASRIRQFAPDKQLTKFLASLPRKELEALFWAMIKGDGSLNYGSRSYQNYIFTQKSKVTLDWFQIIALRLGYYCGTKYDAKGNVSTAYVSKRKYLGLSRGHGKTKEVIPVDYSGIVWCPEVDNGTWVARRDGWPFVTGNSFVALGTSMRIESYARETGERYGVIGSEGTHFRRMPDEELTILQYGTKISIPLRDDEREVEEQTYEHGRGGYTTKITKCKIIGLDELIQTIENVCRFSDIDTYFTITSDAKIMTHSSYSNYSYATTIAKAQRRKVNYTPREYAAKGNQTTAQCFEFELDDPDFCFYGMLAVSGRDEHEVNVDSDNGEVRLLKMPIEATILLEVPIKYGSREEKETKPEYPMTWWFVNLKDELKFAPTPDRERLKEGLYGSVHKKITEFLKSKFAEMEIKSFADYRNSKYKPILNSHSDSHLRDFLTETTREVCFVLDTNVIAVEEPQQTEEHRWRRYSSSYPKLRELVTESENIFILRRELTRTQKEFVLPKKSALTLQKLIRARHPDAIVFLYPAGYSSYQLSEALPKIRELGNVLSEKFAVKDAKTEAEIIKKELGNGWRKATGTEIEKRHRNTEVVVWREGAGSYSRIDPVRMKPSKIGSTVVRIRGNMKEWVDLLKKYSVSDYGVTKEIKILKRGMSEEEFREYLSEKSFTTRDGQKSLGEVGNGPFTVFQFCDPEMLKFYKPTGSQIICTTTDEETFSAVAYLKLSCKKFAVADVVTRKALKQELMKCCDSTKDEGEKSILALVNKDAGDEEATESWTTNQDAANYLYIAVAMMNNKKSDDTVSRASRKKLVSLLWVALTNLSDTRKMKQLVKTAVKYS